LLKFESELKWVKVDKLCFINEKNRASVAIGPTTKLGIKIKEKIVKDNLHNYF